MCCKKFEILEIVGGQLGEPHSLNNGMEMPKIHAIKALVYRIPTA